MRHLELMRARIYLAGLCCLLALACASCGPRMGTQQSIKPFERQMPDMPRGTVPVGGRLATNTLAQSKLRSNPLPATPGNIDNGRVYYGYYCQMCHGSKGDGNGPVGQSYDPKPTDLSSARVAAMTDGQLYYRMLHGKGHDPVMESTVLTGRRWPIVLYIRKTLSHPRR